MFLKAFFKVNFENGQQTTEKHEKYAACKELKYIASRRKSPKINANKLHAGYFFHDFLSSAGIFQHYFSSIKYSFRNIKISLSNSLDPDQDQRSVGPDLGLNRLQRLSPDDKSRR